MSARHGLCILEIERVARLLDRRGDRFLARVFTGGELAYCMPRAARAAHLASRLAAKIAARAAFRQAGLRPPPLAAIEVVRDAWGKPSVRVLAGPPAPPLLVSLSHSREVAAAGAILLGR
ncbi:MAG: 4'-phosphopantetheinyl transferase superfamily protein [bacterium]|nr:4'-phosphopantetheinyl transferase superfamily protein [bacterium]